MNKPRRPAGGRAPSPSQFFRPTTGSGGGRGGGRGGQRAGGRGKLAKGRAGLAPPGGGKAVKTAATEKEETETETKAEARPADRRSSFPAGVKKGGLGFAGVAMGMPLGGGSGGAFGGGPPMGLPFKFSQFAICSALKMQSKRIRSNRSTKST